MAVIAFVFGFLAVGIVVAFIAFSGGPGAAREAYLTRGRRGFRIAIPILYVVLGIAVPAVVASSRRGAEGKAGGLETKHGNAEFNRGKVLFRQTCWSCHTLKAAGSMGVTGTNLDDRVSAAPPPQRLAFVRHAIEIGGTGDGRMPTQLVTGKDADAVAYYVSKVAGK